MKNLREPEQSLRQRCEKLARRYFDRAGLKNDETKALFKMDLEAFAREIRNESLDEAALLFDETNGVVSTRNSARAIRALKTTALAASAKEE